MVNPIIVKLVRLGEPIQQYEISENPTVGHLLDIAGEDFVANCITVNGGGVTESTRLYDGDKVFIGKATKGNVPFEVQIVRLGTNNGIINLPAEEGMTIKQVMDQLPADKKAEFYNTDGKDIYEYRLANGQSAESSHTLSRPVTGSTRLILSTRTKGNE